MSDLDLEDVLQTALDAVRGKKTQAKLDEALSRKFSLKELSEAYRNASDEEREEFREVFGGTPGQVVSESTPKAEEEKPKAKPKSSPKKEDKPKQTRPGRRSGNAYDWDTDEGGRVIKLPVARVYNGPDEEDEVELPEDEDEDNEAA